MWDDEVDEVMLAQLSASYGRRQKWLARLMALELLEVVGETLGAERGQNTGNVRRRAHPETLLQAAGVKIRGN